MSGLPASRPSPDHFPVPPLRLAAAFAGRATIWLSAIFPAIAAPSRLVVATGTLGSVGS